MNLFRKRADRPMRCAEVGRRLQSFLDGALDEIDAARLVEHLDDCRKCGLEVDAYTDIKVALAQRGSGGDDEALHRLRRFAEDLAAGRQGSGQ
ncbi:MAG: zf-HC2 domain-containing protein [Acidimicrobiia bacterium]|nr:zf-HC2 domain-containing protein [Acidimicrobiia bacterium]